METKLCEDVSRTLTDNVLEHWKKDGIKSRFLGWIEIHHLAEHFLKMCREQERDYREFDFYTMLDSTLYYEENRAQIDNILGGLEVEKETAIANKLKDYFSEEQLNEYTAQEKTVIEEVQSKNQSLDKKLSRLTKKIEAQEYLDPELIKQEFESVKETQASIVKKLENIPNLDQLVAAMQKSQSFKAVGEALKPITETKPAPQPKKRKEHIPDKPVQVKQKIRLLDLFPCIMVTMLWAAMTYAALTTWGVNLTVFIEMVLFWLFFPVAIRIVGGGVLD